MRELYNFMDIPYPIIGKRKAITPTPYQQVY